MAAQAQNQSGKGSCSGNTTCCCGSSGQILIEDLYVRSFMTGKITTTVGGVPQISTRLTAWDILGTWKARWSLGRMDYKISPGLYAVGNPDGDSPVLVSANYKMSFDRLREALGGLNLWILVLDTKGINVWCAAGKGTFGTAELVKRIAQVRLTEIIKHRTLILPQLGAPGVAAHEVLKQSGFKVVYGPVRAVDIPEFLKAGLKATDEMRKVRFGMLDRLVLTPMELVGAIKPALIVVAFLFVINLINNGSASFYELLGATMTNFLPYLGAAIVGAVFVPVLLPYIPGRALSWKGWLLGLLWTGIYLLLLSAFSIVTWKQITVYFLLLPPLTSYLAMSFTGSTTYTSLSGVVREMKIALPAQIISAGLGILFMIGKLIFKF